MNVDMRAEMRRHSNQSSEWRTGWFVGVAKAGIPGCTEGYRQLFRELLIKRFKDLPPIVEELLASASRNKIRRWAKRFASGHMLNGVFTQEEAQRFRDRMDEGAFEDARRDEDEDDGEDGDADADDGGADDAVTA